MGYTIESLKDINYSYDMAVGVKESDVDKANALIAAIESSRNQKCPQVGDIVNLTNAYGEYYERAHIEKKEGSELYICESPYTPFVDIYNELISTNTSGGAWLYIPSNLKLVGTQDKIFKSWGNMGACANGAFSFYAKVNVWEYVDGIHEFTTKDYDKWHLSIFEETSSQQAYKYILSKSGMKSCAFKTTEEYEKWKKTFRGIERENYNSKSKIVWAFKETSLCVPLEDYLKIENAVIDSELCNGVIQECKRIYEGSKVTTYLPYQNKRIVLPDTKPYMASNL